MKNDNEATWDATCTRCSHAVMDHEWETDSEPNGGEAIRFCPACGEQTLTFLTTESRTRKAED